MSKKQNENVCITCMGLEGLAVIKAITWILVDTVAGADWENGTQAFASCH